MDDLEAKTEEMQAMSIKEALLESLCGEDVKVFMRMEFAPQGMQFSGKLSRHLTGAWRVQMPAENVRDQQGNPRAIPAQDVYFTADAVAFVIAMPRVQTLHSV